MVFPRFHIDEIRRQEGRDLTRYDLDFDLPDHFLPEFPAPIYLTTRPDLGDVSRGKVVTLENYFELFNGVLNPKQLEGLRLLVTPFPQQQFNADRGPSFGPAEPGGRRASTATPTGTRTGRPISRRTSAPSRTATGSRPRRSGASTSSASSARSGP